MPTVHHHVPTRVILTRAYTHFSYSLPCYPILHTTLLMHSHYSYCSSHPSPLPIPLTPYTYPSISFSLYTFHTHAHASILHIYILLNSHLMLSMHFDFSLVYITPYPSSHAYTILSSALHSSHPALYSSPLTHLLRPIHWPPEKWHGEGPMAACRVSSILHHRNFGFLSWEHAVFIRKGKGLQW